MIPEEMDRFKLKMAMFTSSQTRFLYILVVILLECHCQCWTFQITSTLNVEDKHLLLFTDQAQVIRVDQDDCWYDDCYSGGNSSSQDNVTEPLVMPLSSLWSNSRVVGVANVNVSTAIKANVLLLIEYKVTFQCFSVDLFYVLVFDRITI